jgi:hypothetical protein
VVELTFVLLLVMNGEKVEYTPYSSLSECLSTRRKIHRNVGYSEKWSCKELKVKIKDGNILEIVE